MGQQQLLLLTLAIIIVGIALAIGADMFSESSRQRQSELLVSYCVQVASDVTAWRGKKDSMLGGGTDYTDLEEGESLLDKLGINKHRIPGAIDVENATANTLELVAQSCIIPEIGVRVNIEGDAITITEVAYDGSITLSDGYNEICAGSGYGD